MANSTFGVRLWITCSACRTEVPVGRLEPEIACSKCQAKIALREDLLGEQLAFWTMRVSRSQPGETREVKSIGALTARAELAIEEPHCPLCSKPLLPVTGSSPMTCASCAQPVSIRPAMPWLAAAVSGAFALVSEQAVAFAPPSTTGIVIACANCGAALRPDGANRFATCEHCATVNLIPDTAATTGAPRPRWYIARQ